MKRIGLPSRVSCCLRVVFAALFWLILPAIAAAETLVWDARPATDFIPGNTDSAVINGVTVTSSGTRTGAVDAAGLNQLEIQPTTTINGTTGFAFSIFNAQADDESTSQTVTVSFSEPVYNVSFFVGDIDGGPDYNDGTNVFNDVVEFRANGGTVLPSSGTPFDSSYVAWNAATGRASAISNQNLSDATGQVAVTFAGPVTSLTIRHIGAASNSTNNPTQQGILIEDISFQRAPRLAVRKTSTGGVGTFNFSVTNGVTGTVTTSVTTVTAGTAVTGTQLRLGATNTITTVTETGPAGWIVSSANAACTDANSANSGNPASFNVPVSGYAFAIPAANIRAGAELTCSITNAKRPTVQLRKITQGNIGSFNFTGTNGFGSDTIATAVVNTAVSGVVKTLSASATSTTITETIPTGWQAVSATCTGTAAGNVSFNATTGVLTLNTTATAAANALVCTFTNRRIPFVSVQKVTRGNIGGAFTFAQTGLASTPAGITTAAVNTATPASPAAINATIGTAVTLTETMPAAFVTAGVTCSDANQARTGNAPISSATAAVTLPTTAIVAGAAWNCVFTNDARPTFRVQKITLGTSGGPFSFAQTGLASAPANITTTAVNAATPASPTAINATIGTAVTLTETMPASFVTSGVTCTDANAAITGNTSAITSATTAVTVPAANVKAGATYTCVFTNSRRPRLRITKVSFGGTGAFTFTGNNGWPSETITTVTSGTAVTGTLQELTNVSTATTITEAMPPGFYLTGVTCSGLGSGGTFTPNLAAGSVLFDAAATAPGSNIACTFNNGVPSLAVAKSVDASNASAPVTLGYTISIQNTGTVTLTAPVLSDALTQGPTNLTLTSGPTYQSGDTDADGAIDPGETWTYAASFTMTQAHIDAGGAIANTATVDTAETGPVTSNAATTTIITVPELNLVKQADTAGPVNAGDTITYSFTVTNSGNVTVTGIEIDELAFNGHGPAIVAGNEAQTGFANPPGDSTDAAPNDGVWTALAPGDAITWTATYQVTQQDIDNLQ